MILTKTGVKHSFEEALEAARLKRVEQFLEKEANHVLPPHDNQRDIVSSVGR